MVNPIKSIFLIILASSLCAQVPASQQKSIRIGSLQSHFTAYGSERAWNNAYYEGLRWPADYLKQDNSVIKRFWFGAENFVDPRGTTWNKYSIYFQPDYEGVSLFPVEFKQTAKFDLPNVFVDGININAPFKADIDEINPDQLPDRIITNVVNTSMGLTMTRKILAFSQQYHDNYFIKIFTYTNTGNTDYDDEIELNRKLSGVRISWGTRYSLSREGAGIVADGQSWGKHSWVTRRGEDYASHQGESITEDNPIVQWLRAGFSYSGQGEKNTHDNIGAPKISGSGRLAAPHHTGNAILHVDKSAVDSTDDPDQPVVLGWHPGDTYPQLGDLTDSSPMSTLYSTILSGQPYKGQGGPERFDDLFFDSNPDPWTVHKDGGGTNIWAAYGPFDLEPGESFTIVEVEGINGLSREMCETIGARWKKAYDDPSDKGPFILPDGSETTDKDKYKNEWVFTGKDSIMLTFGRAKRNFDSNYSIPQPPNPPSLFEVNSGGDRIKLSWNASESEQDTDFGGYRVFRAVKKPDTTFQEIFACGIGTENPTIVYEFNDKSPQRGFSYYYYIIAFNDGTNNVSGLQNPTGVLHSNRFYTKTTEPAFLQRPPGERIEDVRIIPNPFNIRAQKIQFGDGLDQNRIMFFNIPAFCKIKIFTERGDLIKTINHDDGSGDEAWNSVTSSRQVIVSGIYIAYIEVTKTYHHPETGELLYRKGENVIRKFIVIR